MSAPSASAPGKLFLGGEYAVLEGAEAVVTAVTRRARAHVVKSGAAASRVISAVREHVSRHFEEGLSTSRPLPEIEVASPGFRIGKDKVGLGSSAAVSSAACGVFFEWAGFSIPEHRSEILSIATAAHRSSQGGKGSGADVAATVLGGTLIFERSGKIEPIDIDRVHMVPVWSGTAASTAGLIGIIEAFALRDPDAHRDRFDELGRGAAELASAFRAGDCERIIAAMSGYGRLMDELGKSAGASIVTREHRLAMKLAADLGGAAKPSGAGGGDVAIAVFGDQDAAERFRAQCLRYELVPLDLDLGAPGLRRED